MISRDIEAIETLVAAHFNPGGLLEFFSTNKPGNWILQLTHETKKPIALLLSNENFYALCTGLKQCIDTAMDSSNYPNAKVMTNTIAVDLPSTTSESGAILFTSSWDSDPVVQFKFYSNTKNRDLEIDFVYYLEDAKRLFDLFFIAYQKNV